jgi:RNA polymerase sigma-54 factor
LSVTFEFAMTPRFGLEVSPALIAFSEMLMLPCAALRDVVEDELSANAELERLEPGECPICRGSWTARCPLCAVPARTCTVENPPRSSDVPDTDSDVQALRRLVHAEIPAADGALADYLIDSLDHHGLFDQSPAEMAADLAMPEDRVAGVVAAIRRCGPPGLGATGVAECLLLQLDALHLPDDALARAVIADHLAALGRGHFAAIAETLGTTREAVRAVLDLIRRRMRPYPAFDGANRTGPAYVVPDVVIQPDGDGFRVELVEVSVTRLRARPGGPGSGAARMFLAQLRDRWTTLRRVTEHVVDRQRAFLARGAAHLVPLTRAEVATALGLHESTVSRAVADKYVLMPDGTTTPLAAFFSGSGGADETLRRILHATHGRLSDQQLADRLRDAGYPMTRRTVAKHRSRLGFAAAVLR